MAQDGSPVSAGEQRGGRAAGAAGPPDFPVAGANRYVYAYIDGLPDLTGRTVVDIPCGDGRASYRFARKGATVVALDLFPEFMNVPGITAGFADMSAPLPLADESADYVICQEGIEHIPDQLGLLREFNRVLKVGGTLVLTTPSLSHARARLSWLLFESDFWRRMPASEIDSVWGSGEEGGRIYFGHLFLRGVHHLQALAAISGFAVTERRRTDVGAGAVIIGLLLYPLLAVMSLSTYRAHSRKRGRNIPAELRRRVWWNHVRLNLSPTTLFCKHMLWILHKQDAAAGRQRHPAPDPAPTPPARHGVG